MRRRLLLILIVAGLALGSAEAQPRGSGGGRSYSSGSGGKSYSSGSSSKGFSSGSSSSSKGSSFSSGKSYSSGSSSPSKYSSFGSSSGSKSAPSSSGGKSYSSGSSTFGNSTSKPPPKSSYDSGAGSAQKRTESSSTFNKKPTPPPTVSSGGKSYTAPKVAPTPRGESSSPVDRGPPVVRPGGKSYASGQSSPTSNIKPPSGGRYDQSAASAQQREASRTAFTKGAAPKPTYTDSSGTSRPIDPKDRQIEDLRRDLDQTRWENRELRKRRTYEPYINQPRPPVVVYRDPYSDLFWFWLLSQSLDQRASWAYHRRDTMDLTRYREMLARDAQLEARIKQLEQEGKPRDPAYQPPGVDRDLMYSDQYVDAAYNPQPPPPSVVNSNAPSGRSGGGALRVLLIIVVILALLCFAIWLVFFKRWGGT
jgi:hypothetical protein